MYDESHVGHALCYLRLDLIRRVLEHRGFSVVYVMNITDVDDKIIQRAQELKISYLEVARKYEASFFQDLAALNIRKPSIVLRATEHINEIVHFIEELMRLGYAYRTTEGVFFDTSRDSAYPRFRQVDVDQNTKGVKRNARDFALWKPEKAGEPSWTASFGSGRPGWHIECSAMASKVFGNDLDLHSGGKDLEFPHHENEEAQCCAFHQRSTWARCYIHPGFVRLSGDKMSKSIGNVIHIKDFLKDHSAEKLRMICLRFPLRAEIDFRDKLVSESASALAKLNDALALSDDYLRGRFSADISQHDLLKALNITRENVDKALADDFSFARATAQIVALTDMLVQALRKTEEGKMAPGHVAVASLSNYIRNYYCTMGFRLDTMSGVAEDSQLSNIVDKMMDFRFEVRQLALALSPGDERDKLLKSCDEFREDLQVEGIAIKDMKYRTSWTRSH